MIQLTTNSIVTVQPQSLHIGDLILEQDEPLLITDIQNYYVTFIRLSTNTTHTVEKIALELTTEYRKVEL